jgi:hypothetical protein
MAVHRASDLRAAGFSNDHAEREVRAGRWQRPLRGVYLPHNRPATDQELVAIAEAHAGRDFVVSGLVVLRELGLRWLPGDRGIHVLVPKELDRRSSRPVRVTRTTAYPDLDTWSRHGARYADVARAVVDAGRGIPRLQDVRGVVLGAVADGFTSPEELRRLVDSGRRNGSAMVRRAVEDARRGCASPPEAEVVDALIGRGVPFYVNPQLWLDGVLVGSPDVWLVGTGTGGEVDSRERHGNEVDTENTYDRHERFGGHGLQLVHLSVRRIRADADEAAGHLLSRRHACPVAPDGLVVVPRGPLLR